MNNYEFDMPTKVFFGEGMLQNLKEIKKYGNKVLLHYGKNSIKNNGIYDKVVECLKENGIEYVDLGGVEANPNLTLAYEGIKICKEQNIDFILAVGGGSTIDSAKAIALGSKVDVDVWDYYTGKVTEDYEPLPIGVVLTIPAAGSETSPISVLVNKETKAKLSVRSEKLRAKFSVLDPTFTFSLSAYQIACGCSDILAHLMERYFTPTKDVAFTDALLEGAMRTVVEMSEDTVNNLNDYNKRSEIMQIGSLAHNDALSMGRVGDWACHGIERNVSGYYDNAHGEGLSIIYPAWCRTTYKTDEKRFLQFFKNVFNLELTGDNEKDIKDGILLLEKFYTSIGLAIRFSDTKDINMTEEHKKQLAKQGENSGAFHKLSYDDIIKLLDFAM